MYCNNPFNYLRFPANIPLGGMPDSTQQMPYYSPMPGQQFPMYSTSGNQPLMNQGMSDQMMPSQMMPGQTMQGQMMPGQMMPGQTMQGQMMPSQTMPGQMMPGQTMQGQMMPGQIPPGVPLTGAAPVDFSLMPPMPVMDIEYTQGYMKTQIGRRVKAEFLIGTNMLVDREGILVDVGISYIIINETDTDDLLLCDIYSIKFVRFYY